MIGWNTNFRSQAWFKLKSRTRKGTVMVLCGPSQSHSKSEQKLNERCVVKSIFSIIWLTFWNSKIELYCSCAIDFFFLMQSRLHRQKSKKRGFLWFHNKDTYLLFRIIVTSSIRIASSDSTSSINLRKAIRKNVQSILTPKACHKEKRFSSQ